MLNLFKKDEYSNVIGPVELEKAIRKALEFESEVFSRTLGPYGANTIIEDHMLHHTMTKDGFTVYRSLVLYPRLARVAAKLFQKISGSLNDIVGDGTTSSVIVANELYKHLKKLTKKFKVTPQFLSIMIKTVGEYLNSLVKKTAVNIYTTGPNGEFVRTHNFDNFIQSTAAISLNNDWKAGKLVAEIFSKLQDPRHGFINAEISKSASTHYDMDRGFEIPRGMVLPEMITEPDGKRAIYTTPKILVIKGHLVTTDAESIRHVVNYVIGQLNKPLVIVSGGFSEAIRETFRQSIIRFAETNNSIMKLLCIELDTESSIGKETVQDLAANIGARIITVDSAKPFPIEKDPTRYEAYFGTCEKIVSNTTTYTRFIGGTADTDKIHFRISDIDKEIDRMKSEVHIDNQYNIFLLQRRKAALLGDMITLNIGGDTIEEKENKQHLFDDALRGCKSAVQNGIVVGGNTIIPRLCRNIINGSINSDELLDKLYNNLKNSMTKHLTFEEYYHILHGYTMRMLQEIQNAYTDVYAIILDNYYHDWKRSRKKAKYCIENDVIYNLVTNREEPAAIKTTKDDAKEVCQVDITHKNTVLNSAEVDTQILTAAISILDLVMSSNQFIRVPQIEEMKKHL